jgi:hypothetical protein
MHTPFCFKTTGASSVIPTLTDRQAAHVLEDTVSSIHIILGTDSDATRQFHMEKLAGIIENITGYKEDISVSMVGNGLNVRIDPDPDGTSTNDRSGFRLVQDPCSNQIGSAKMTYPYENRTDCEVEKWIECIENSGTVKWAQLHCDDLAKLFDDPSAPLPPTPPPNNNTLPEPPSNNNTVPEPEPEPVPVPVPVPDPEPEPEVGEGEDDQPPVDDQDQGDNSGEDQGSEDSGGDSGEEEPTLPQFGE